MNIKLWWQLRRKLKTELSGEDKKNILAELVLIAKDEIENARETINIVKMDSRLGWEPTMGYLTDPSRLSWKIEQVERVINEELLEERC